MPAQPVLPVPAPAGASAFGASPEALRTRGRRTAPGSVPDPADDSADRAGGLIPQARPAVLALADGSIFRGSSVGAGGQVAGEAVFNTAMSGYQEILTDPSYCRQIVALTCPHVGNCGVNPEDGESARIHAAGLVVKDLSAGFSNWRGVESLTQRLVREGVPAIAGIDTRRLTRILRAHGAQGACLVAAAAPDEPIDERAAVQVARAFPGLAGMDLARVVSTREPYRWTDGPWRPGDGFTPPVKRRFRVVVYDFGVKRNILRLLVERGCELIVLPAQTGAPEALAWRPDGIFLSNGPGDPEPCAYAIAAVRELIDTDIPVFGICLGHQIIGLASGARTMKMKFGHHGANHPVRSVDTGQVSITSQNHGFAVDPASLPANLRITHRSLFDGSIQGLERTDRAVFCFQGHPEASPGPQDVHHLFDRFVALMGQRQ